jgi:hypothetical protein
MKYTKKEIEKALNELVKKGYLDKCKKNGKDAWIDSKLTKELRKHGKTYEESN